MSIDSRYIERDGLRYHVQVIGDNDTTPEDDGDWCTEADLQDWRDCRWQYVGIVVGIEDIEESKADLWSIVWGTLREAPAELDLDYYINNLYMSRTGPDGIVYESTMIEALMDEALINARAYRTKLCALPL
jgi:hypothetical protein